MTSSHPITYWDYLHLDDLLTLQRGLAEDDAHISEDELHFIVVHQAFELWFKLILRELRLARDKMAAPFVEEETIPYVVHHLRRVVEIFRLATEQFRVMETLTPQDFLAFRDKLGTASGFQSLQMREIEAMMGLQEHERAAFGHADPVAAVQSIAQQSPHSRAMLQRLQQARQEVSLRQALHTWLYRTPIQGSRPCNANDAEVVQTFLEAYCSALQQQQAAQIDQLVADGADRVAISSRFEASLHTSRAFLAGRDVAASERTQVCRIRAALLFIESYRDLPLLAWPRLLLDTVVETEELFILWRTRHARMVERVIGRRVGTGGSSGVDYLDETTKYRIFPELWAVRTLLLPRAALPALQQAALYRFAAASMPSSTER
jgi:tryptophan 2,3-dioxygenase